MLIPVKCDLSHVSRDRLKVEVGMTSFPQSETPHESRSEESGESASEVTLASPPAEDISAAELTPDQVESKLNGLDLSLFPVESQTTDDDKRSLLAIQILVRQIVPDYTYVEIGSHLGGTLAPHLVDARCRQIISIDKRPLLQLDERGRSYDYDNNSTDRMIQHIRRALPAVNLDKLVTFDADAADVAPDDYPARPDLAFIDGEHMNRAAISDFLSIFKVCNKNSAIVFHASALVVDAIGAAESFLRYLEVPFKFYLMPDSISVFLLGALAGLAPEEFQKRAVDSERFFRRARDELWIHIAQNVASPRLDPFRDFELALKAHILGTLDAYPSRPQFLEIGANDGRPNGMIYPFLEKGWRGALVEPVPYLFERLSDNVSAFRNVVALPYACGPERGRRTFYSVVSPKDRNKNGWIEFIGSFDRDVIMRHQFGFADLESHIREIEVDVYTATDLVEKAGLDHIDCLIIDVEGYDDVVLRSLDLTRYQPEVITIEHRHIRGTRHDDIIQFCRSNGYQALVLNWDTVFLKGEITKKIDLPLIDRLIATLSQYATP